MSARRHNFPREVEPPPPRRGEAPESFREMQELGLRVLRRHDSSPPTATKAQPRAAPGTSGHDPMQNDEALERCGHIVAGKMAVDVVLVRRGGGKEGLAARMQISGPGTIHPFGVRFLAAELGQLIEGLLRAQAQLAKQGGAK